MRVPFLVRFPGRYPAGQVIDAPASTLDLVPTALALAGLEASDGDDRLDGLDLGPALEGGGAAAMPPERPLYWRMGARAALRLGDWKIVRHGAPGRGAGGVRPPPPWELYHLAVDPAETRDLAASEPERLAALVAAWEALVGEMAEPRF